MRSSRVLTGAALSIAALGLSASSAFAGNFGKIEVTPNPVKAGNSVNLNSSDCGKNGSATVDASTLAPARSPCPRRARRTRKTYRLPAGAGRHEGGQLRHRRQVLQRP